jgi:hypothetical protein
LANIFLSMGKTRGYFQLRALYGKG